MINKKKIVLLILLIVSILSFLYLTKSPSKKINDLYITNSEYNELIKDKTLSHDLDISSLKLDDYSLIKDNSNNLYYSLIEGSSTSYNPSIEIDRSLFIVFVGNQITDSLIENNEHIKVLIYNSKQYNEYSLICTTLPLINIDTEGDVSDEDVGGEISVFDNSFEALDRFIISDLTLHIRGVYSRTFPKKNFKINLKTKSLGNNERNNSINLLGLREDDDYILYSCYNDDTKVRKVFCNYLWKETCAVDNEFNVNNGVEYKYVELIMNGEYYGLYALGYKIDGKQLNLGDEDILYRKATMQIRENHIDINNAKNVEGYEIVECGKKVNEDDAWIPLKDYLICLLNSNEDNYENLSSIVDINNDIDYYLFINMIQGADNWLNNTLYNCYILARKVGDYYKIMLVPWDMDTSWGKDLQDGLFSYPEYNVITEFCVTHRLYYFDDTYKENVKRVYFDKRNSVWSEDNLLNILDKFQTDIYDSGAFARDKLRWTEGTYNEEEVKLANFEEYVKKRLIQMDNWVNLS